VLPPYRPEQLYEQAGTISVMPVPGKTDEPSPKSDEEPGFLVSHQSREAISRLPWIIAAAVVIVAIGVWILVGGRANPDLPSTGTGMAPADPYAASLPISGLQMSQADTFSGSKVTYVDGQISNTGNRTLTAITVQVGFHSDVGQYAQRLAVPLSLIRTRQPYVDIEPVSAAPIEPGQQRDFRLIFDTVPADWNQQYPEIRVISVHSK
jgi:hypothetical protein